MAALQGTYVILWLRAIGLGGLVGHVARYQENRLGAQDRSNRAFSRNWIPMFFFWESIICDTLIYFCNRQCPPFFKHNETIYDRLHGHVLENTPPKVVHRAVGTKIRPRLLVGDVYPTHAPAVVSPNGRLLFWSAFLLLTPSLFLPAKQ